ncbi:hypothetical protein BGW80DRAFT_1562925 [Lactifluus volemus]|nr:hypothetical protein BGW80DRAFT_1562925 [Lactifluus volemus]
MENHSATTMKFLPLLPFASLALTQSSSIRPGINVVGQHSEQSTSSPCSIQRARISNLQYSAVILLVSHRYTHQKADLIVTPGFCGNERRQSPNQPEEGAAEVLVVKARGKKKK